MQVSIAPSYVVQAVDRQNAMFKTDRQITDVLIRNAVVSKFPEGMKAKEQQKTWSRILNSLTRAILAQEDSLELELGQVEWLLVALNEWACPAGMVGWLNDLRLSLEDVERQASEAPKNGAAKPAVAKAR